MEDFVKVSRLDIRNPVQTLLGVKEDVEVKKYVTINYIKLNKIKRTTYILYIRHENINTDMKNSAN